MIKIDKCVYCNGTSFTTEQKGNQVGLYCESCGKWIKWLSKDEQRLYKNNVSDGESYEKGYNKGFEEGFDNGYKVILDDFEKEFDNFFNNFIEKYKKELTNK